MGTMQIVRVAICLTFQETYGLGVEDVKKPFGPRLGALVPLERRLPEHQALWPRTQMVGFA
jgi:hypothetical protein